LRDSQREDTKEALDACMPFENEVGGDLTMESFLKLRNEMTAHTYQCFQPRKEQLM